MTSIKAIETRYRGRRFRSRVEARWAVFFDALSLEWEYEKEGFELPSGRYLPDFWLPRVQVGCWFEVKGQAPTERERQLACELARGSGFPVYIFAGYCCADFGPADYYKEQRAGLWKMFLSEGGDALLWNEDSLWAECSRRAKKVSRKGTLGEEWILFQPEGIGFFPGGEIFEKQQFSICRDCASVGIVSHGSAAYLPCQDMGSRLCKHCYKEEGQHRVTSDDNALCATNETFFETVLDRYPVGARAALLKQERLTPFQEELLRRHCDCGGLELREQMRLLEKAFEKAVGARFEFGEEG